MNLLDFADYAGTFAFAVSGTLSASEKKLDLFGASFIGFITAVGGGTMRDLLMGNTPVTWVKNVDYFLLIFSAIIFTFIFFKRVIKLKHTLFLFDTIGIGVFTIIGIDKALIYDLSAPICMVMGLSSAVVGGVIRDTLCNDVPLIFHKEIYATACIVGGTIYLLLDFFNVNLYFSQIATITSIIIIRLLAVKYNLSLPKVTFAQK
ncbi:trimeric intracellular cation channel family protein [Plebeiibacterium sediminum]|uniref:Trimeric intracellular cation channel family protein n=1 Tax=Plebeiibacterium sediminum TaxID=2992112 RepID=A0AAE3M7R7_9BACT|nr:trimeric intracellular cation channel family protein [Plebeiobacterium sediminum]MCW3788831.1 trimeric intracellular cation channel family protein [Plebeiobacterium sediminum]